MPPKKLPDWYQRPASDFYPRWSPQRHAAPAEAETNQPEAQIPVSELEPLPPQPASEAASHDRPRPAGFSRRTLQFGTARPPAARPPQDTAKPGPSKPPRQARKPKFKQQEPDGSEGLGQVAEEDIDDADQSFLPIKMGLR